VASFQKAALSQVADQPQMRITGLGMWILMVLAFCLGLCATAGRPLPNSEKHFCILAQQVKNFFSAARAD